jgi:diguanylate cyclase (GGDEF)-like protein
VTGVATERTASERPAWAAFAAVLAASAVLLIWLLSGLGGPTLIQRADDLGTTLAPLVAVVGCARAARRSAGSMRAGWILLAASCGCWATGQAIWTWYELIAGRPVPFPSPADAGFLSAVPLAVAAVLTFPVRDRRTASQVRAVLDGCIIAVSLLYTSWALVLGPVFRARSGSVLEQLMALFYPAGDVIVVAVVVAVLAGRRSAASLGLLSTGLVCLAVADSGFAYFTQVGDYHTGFPTDVGWFAGYLLIAVAARPLERQRQPSALAEWSRLLLPYVPVASAVTVSVTLHLRRHGSAGPFLYWSFASLMVLVVARQLLTILDNQALNRELTGVVERLRHQAFHDPLTNLANRALFDDRLAHALTMRARHPQPLAALLIDVDDFKAVNDTLGHAAGDALLVAVAGRLLECVRGEDTVARLGGDEFAILLEQLPDPRDAQRLGDRIVAAMGAGFSLGGIPAHVTVSVGVAVSTGAETTDAVMHQADTAMYAAKALGKDRVECSSAPAPSPVEER